MSAIRWSTALIPSCTTVTCRGEHEAYWKKLMTLWGLSPSRSHFPGSNPVSLERHNIDDLAAKDYVVGLKADGVRYILFLTMARGEHVALMINRANVMYEVEVWGNAEYFERGTILDGELVHNGTLAFIVFDAIAVKGERTSQVCYRERLHVIHNMLLLMSDLSDDTVERMVDEEDKIVARNNLNQLILSPKTCVSKRSIEELWNQRASSSHHTDGLIFTSNTDAITPGTSRSILKWKPCHSVDLLVRRAERGEVRVFANNNGDDGLMEVTHRIGPHRIDVVANELLELVTRDEVVEFIIDPAENGVRLLADRQRFDRTSANTVKTALATIQNAFDNIEVEELIRALA